MDLSPLLSSYDVAFLLSWAMAGVGIGVFVYVLNTVLVVPYADRHLLLMAALMLVEEIASVGLEGIWHYPPGFTQGMDFMFLAAASVITALRPRPWKVAASAAVALTLIAHLCRVPLRLEHRSDYLGYVGTLDVCYAVLLASLIMPVRAIRREFCRRQPGAPICPPQSSPLPFVSSSPPASSPPDSALGWRGNIADRSTSL